MNISLKSAPSLVLFIPFYIDLARPLHGIFWPHDWISMADISIPIPLSLFAILFFCVYDYLNPQSSFLLDPSNRFASSTTLLVFCLSAFFFSSLTPVRLIQLSLPIILFVFIKVPPPVVAITRVAYAVVGLSFFEAAHISFILFEYQDLAYLYLNVDPKSWFVTFWGSYLYSGLVSLPAVIILSIPIALLIQSYPNMSRLKLSTYAVSLFVLAQTFYLVVFARKASLAILASFVLLYTVFKIVPRLICNLSVRSAVIKRSFLLTVSCVVLFLSGSPIVSRLLYQAGEGDLSSGRMGKYLEFFRLLLQTSPHQFFFGLGFVELPPGFHNVFFDTFARVGFVGLILIFGTLFYQISSVFYYLLSLINSPISTLALFVVSSLLVESLFNAQLTQPFYISSLLFFIVSSFSVSQPKLA